jgi:Kef-type K+ transport system membrane component KefB
LKLKIISQWMAIAVVEIILSLVLLAIAPIFLNSNQPILGFLIWLIIPTILIGSGVYVLIRLRDAQKSRKIFVSRFPEYSHLKITDFLEFSSSYISENLEMLENAKNDPSLESLNLSLLDLLRNQKHH